MKDRKYNKKINEPKIWLFEKVNKFIGRLTKRKKKKMASN